MSLLIVGSIALDSIQTPFGKVTEALGGSATYAALAACYLTRVGMVGVVGKDFPSTHLRVLRAKGINLDGVETRAGRTFRWKGAYGYDLNVAQDLETHLNVFQDFQARIPDGARAPGVLFLAAIHPALQRAVLRRVRRPRLIACDTRDLWIREERATLARLLKEVDMMLLNDSEARALSGEANLVKAARAIQKMGPAIVVVKRGDAGAILFDRVSAFSAPAYLLDRVSDPTGAGDSFAGGLLGMLAAGRMGPKALRQAVVLGSVMASFTVEAFGVERLRTVTRSEIRRRYHAFRRLVAFEGLS